MAQPLHRKKHDTISISLGDFQRRKEFPPIQHDSPPHINSNANFSSRRNPLSVRVVNVFADKQICWTRGTWNNVRSALSKKWFSSVEEVEETDRSEESSSDRKCCHQERIEVITPFERHILLCISKQPLVKGRMLLHVIDNTLNCKCAHDVGSHGECDYGSASSVGIFLQGHAKDGVNLAHRLMDGNWGRRRLHTLAFARVRGEPAMICTNVHHPQMDFDETFEPQLDKQSNASPFTLLHRICLEPFKERVLSAVPQQQMEFPNKEVLDSVQDFFTYTEFEGKQVFEEFDRDADGRLTMDDVMLAMKKMKLPSDYAKNFMKSRHQLWPTKSFGWCEFSSLIQEKEPVIIQLFNSLGVSKSGTVNRIQMKDSLSKAGLSATEANVSAMMKFLGADTGECIKYGQFRRFMLLLPTEQLTTNPWTVWLKAATGGGVEPLSEDLQVSVLKYASSLIRSFQSSRRQKRFESEPIPC